MNPGSRRQRAYEASKKKMEHCSALVDAIQDIRRDTFRLEAFGRPMPGDEDRGGRIIDRMLARMLEHHNVAVTAAREIAPKRNFYDHRIGSEDLHGIEQLILALRSEDADYGWPETPRGIRHTCKHVLTDAQFFSPYQQSTVFLPAHQKSDALHLKSRAFGLHDGTVVDAMANLEERLEQIYPGRRPHIVVESPGSWFHDPTVDIPFQPYLEAGLTINVSGKDRVAIASKPEGLEPLLLLASSGDRIGGDEEHLKVMVEAWASEAATGVLLAEQLHSDDLPSLPTNLRGAANRDLGREANLTLDQVLSTFSGFVVTTKRKGLPEFEKSQGAIFNADGGYKANQDTSSGDDIRATLIFGSQEGAEAYLKTSVPASLRQYMHVLPVQGEFPVQQDGQQDGQADTQN